MVNVWLLLLFVTGVLSSYFEEYELTNDITPKNIQKGAMFVVTGSTSHEKKVDGEIEMVYTPKNGLYWDEKKENWFIYDAQDEVYYHCKIWGGQKEEKCGKWQQWERNDGTQWYEWVVPMKVMVKPAKTNRLIEKETTEVKLGGLELGNMEVSDMIMFNIPNNLSLHNQYGTLLELQNNEKWLILMLEEKERQIRAPPSRLIKLTDEQKQNFYEKINLESGAMKVNDMIVMITPGNPSLNGKYGTLLDFQHDKWLIQMLEEKDRQSKAPPTRLIKLTDAEKLKVYEKMNKFAVNDLVVFDSLKNSQWLNGKHGKVVDILEAGKCNVQMIDEDQKFKVNYFNLIQGKIIKNIPNFAKLDYIIKSDYLKEKLIVVDFSSSHCGPCNAIAPIFEQFAQYYPKVLFIKVDVDENKEAAIENEISSVPTFKFYKNGHKIDEFKGANQTELYNKVNKFQ